MNKNTSHIHKKFGEKNVINLLPKYYIISLNHIIDIFIKKIAVCV